MKVWKWIKNKAVWIALALSIVFYFVLDKFFDSQKIKNKKRDAEKKISESEELSEKSLYYDGVESGLSKSETLLDSRISDIEKSSEKTKRDIGDMDAEEVADRFNSLYGSDSRPN